MLTPADQERVLQTKSAMIAVPKRAPNRSGALLTAALACLVSTGIYAAEIPGSALLFAGDSIGLAQSHPDTPPYPMVLDRSAGLGFDRAEPRATGRPGSVMDRPTASGIVPGAA